MLAGGASSRLGGTPKGLENVGGRRIIDRVADALRGVTSELVLIANDPSAASWLPEVPVIRDIHPGRGGLAGVHAALVSAAGRDVLVVAWDMPFIAADLLRALVAAAHEHGADVTLPASDSPYGFEPFCAFYGAPVVEPLAAFLESGGGAAREFLHRLPRLVVLPSSEIDKLGDSRTLFLSVNTPADLERARAVARARE